MAACRLRWRAPRVAPPPPPPPSLTHTPTHAFASAARSHAREGLLWLLAFLPTALGNGFSDYISSVLPVIIGGLADDSDTVRDVALRAGQVIVKHFATTHTGILLPSLQAGMFDENWRIRQSSVTLLGDLMFSISGAKALGVVEDEDDDTGMATDANDAAIIAQLGLVRRPLPRSAVPCRAGVWVRVGASASNALVPRHGG